MRLRFDPPPIRVEIDQKGLKLRVALGLCIATSLCGWGYAAAAQPKNVRLAVVDDNPTSATAITGESAPSTAANDWGDICLSHRDDLEEGGRMAAANGWIVAPDNLAAIMKNVTGKPQVWLQRSDSGLKLLIIGRMEDSLTDDSPKFAGRFCAIGIMPAEVDAEREVASLIAVPPNPSVSKPGRITYVYRHTAQGLAPILSDLRDPTVAQAIQSSDVDVVLVGVAAKITLIALITPDGR